MTLTPPSAGDPNRVPSAPSPYAGPPPSVGGAHWSGGPVNPQNPGAPGASGGPGVFGAPAASGPVKPRPSWVAWTALGLSVLSFIVVMSLGIIYAADRLGASGSGEEYFYDAGAPTWGQVDLAPSGAATELALITGVTEALHDGVEEGTPVEEVYCDPIPAPKKDTVTSCSALVDELDSTVVLLFLDDEGGFLATLY